LRYSLWTSGYPHLLLLHFTFSSSLLILTFISTLQDSYVFHNKIISVVKIVHNNIWIIILLFLTTPLQGCSNAKRDMVQGAKKRQTHLLLSISMRMISPPHDTGAILNDFLSLVLGKIFRVTADFESTTCRVQFSLAGPIPSSIFDP
jgi:hypothetical protein